MKTEEDFEIFWETTEGLTRDETPYLLSHSIPAAFPDSFLFHLPGMGEEEGISGFSFFDSAGAFTKAMVMETAGRQELETLLQAYLSFKEEAESFFRGRGSRVFQPGVETRLVLFARTFHPELIQHLRFYGVRASLISYALIQGGGKKGILLRRVREEELGVRDRPPMLERGGYEKTEGFFFRETGLDPEERRALERFRSSSLEPRPEGLTPPPEFGPKDQSSAFGGYSGGGVTRAQGKQGGEDALF